MRKYLIVVGLLFAIINLTKAQQVEISGQIIDKETHEPVPYVHVVNISTQKGTVSNTEGRFWVIMDKQDTLQFSSIGFEKSAFTLKPDITTDKMDITIALDESTMELKPVNVFAFKNEQSLKRAILEMDDLPMQQEEKLTIPGVKRMGKPVDPNGGISLGGPLSAIAKVFSKEEKEKKLLKQYQKDYDYRKVLTSKYNETVVMQITDLPEDKVEEFMEFCVLEDSFIYRATEYELAVVLNQCLVDFEKLKKEEDD